MLKRVILLTFISLLFFACTREAEPDITAVESQIKKVQALHTCEYVYRDIIYLDEPKSFLIIKGKARRPRALFSINVRVQAGVDLSDGLHLYRDGEDRNIIYVKMPAAKILIVDADENSIEQFFSKEKVGLIETSDIIDSKKEQIIQDAIERGILYRAEENAKKILGDLLRYSGFDRVEFSIINPEEREIRG